MILRQRSNFLKVGIHIAKAYKHTAFFPGMYILQPMELLHLQSLTIAPQHFQQENFIFQALHFSSGVDAHLPGAVRERGISILLPGKGHDLTWRFGSGSFRFFHRQINGPPKKTRRENKGSHQNLTRWWFQIFFIFIPTWGNDPI